MTLSPSNSIWTSTQAAKVTNGKSISEWFATGISIDSRTINEGDLFIAIKGKTDGHEYVADALAKGAVAAIVEHIPENLNENAPLLIVKDTMEAMQALGQASRSRTSAKIIAITGSVGKTSTKEMLGRILKEQGQTHYSKGSYNNHLGVPYTLASMHAGTDYGVFEIGMNHAGEITALTKQVQPDIAIITTIAPVHMEFFDSVKDIATAKAEIFQGVKENGTVILPRDNEFFDYLVKKANLCGIKNILSFGINETADAKIIEIIEASNGSKIKAIIKGEEVEYSIKIPGKHQALNSLSVLLAAKCAGADLQKAAVSISKINPAKGRGALEKINIGDPDNPVTLIDETYNASPESMKAAFRVMALIDTGRNGRKIAILGDMLELGKKSAQMHADLALPIKAAGIDLVYTCGPLMKNLHDNLAPELQVM